MRKIIIAISCCIVLLLLGFASYRGYQVWKQNHLLAMAKQSAARQDFNTELIWLQQVLHVNPRNMEANRMMAALQETARMPGALIYRQKVLDLNPQSLDDRLALAQSAMLFKDFVLATNTLASIDEAGRNTSSYHNIAGLMAVALRQLDEAQKHFTEAARLDPGNLVPQMNLAVVRLQSSNTLDAAEARIDLKRISQEATNLDLRMQAARELVADAARSKDYDAALALAKSLVQSTNNVISDKLMVLGLLKVAKKPEFQSTLVQYQREASQTPVALSEMASWMMAQTTPTETLAWLQGLPPQMQTNQPGAMLIAQNLMAIKNWAGLELALDKKNWGDLDFSRHAFLARAMRELNLGGTSDAEWALALKDADASKSEQIMLFRMAAEWNWVDEAEQILWTIVNRYPEEQWAAPMLRQALTVGGRTRPLMQLLVTMSKRQPNDLGVKNDLATVAMLLEAQELSPFDTAREVYEKDSKNPSYITTYAFSLYQQKNYAEALKVMQQLPPKFFEIPAVAGYYGLMLKANGDTAKAKAFLELAAKAQSLPEEKKLIESALRQ
jgi:tetratricopeptide (TPR) repeat protein